MNNPETEKINYQEEAGLGERKSAFAIERGIFKRNANAKTRKKVLFEKKPKK